MQQGRSKQNHNTLLRRNQSSSPAPILLLTSSESPSATGASAKVKLRPAHAAQHLLTHGGSPGNPHSTTGREQTPNPASHKHSSKQGSPRGPRIV